MKKLVQNDECSIIYDEKGEEVFRCPRALDDKDLVRYINEYRAFVGLETDDTENLEAVEGMELIDYWRMYYRDGWYGRWMIEGKNRPTELECAGANQFIKWLTEKFDKGCDYWMKDYFADNFPLWGVEKERYLLRPIKIDTKYGNGDYPVRIYIYREKKA